MLVCFLRSILDHDDSHSRTDQSKVGEKNQNYYCKEIHHKKLWDGEVVL